MVRESVAVTPRSRALACRLVTLEELVGLAGGAAMVDEVMRELLPRSFAEAWQLG